MVRDTHLDTIAMYFKQHYDGEVEIKPERDVPEVWLTFDPSHKFGFRGCSDDDEASYLTTSDGNPRIEPLELVSVNSANEGIHVVLRLREPLSDSTHERLLEEVEGGRPEELK